jgi:predicted PurR-regulated permease PerM
MNADKNGKAKAAAPDLESTDLARISLPPLLTLTGVTAILYFGKDILMPMAVAILLTFALAPIVSFLRRRGVPRVIAVILTVALAFVAIASFAFLVATQVSTLAQNIPTYQSNIISKIDSLKDIGGGGGGLIDRLSNTIDRVGQELQDATTAAEAAGDSVKPMPVEVIERQSPLDILVNIVMPLISPFATAGLIVVVVIFMLIEREDLRDRFIRLVGAGDLHRTTEALQDAGSRVGRYLLMQLVVNTTYAIPISLGLWLLGVPNALLWGLLTLVLRFVPYIGPAIGMILPMMVAFAVLPGWAPLLWTAALFLGVELFSNNVMEPWLYGSRTGVSPLAIIVAAIFWSWLWGPIGLVLSTPLTVCLAVLGRHVPQFEFFDVMFSNNPVLEPSARVYQRLLAGDPDEAVDHAEQFLDEGYLVSFYDTIAVPALLRGEEDRTRGVMNEETQARFASAAMTLVKELEDVAEEESHQVFFAWRIGPLAGHEPLMHGDRRSSADIAGNRHQRPDGNANQRRIMLPEEERRRPLSFATMSQLLDACCACPHTALIRSRPSDTAMQSTPSMTLLGGRWPLTNRRNR